MEVKLWVAVMGDAGAGGVQPAAAPSDPVSQARLGEIHGFSLPFLSPPTLCPSTFPQQPVTRYCTMKPSPSF